MTMTLVSKPDKESIKDNCFATPLTIHQAVFGIRFEPQFGILDHIGKIVDLILRGKGSPFSSKLFPFSTSNTTSHTLHGEDTLIRIGHQDLICQLPFNTTNTDEIKAAADNFQQFIIKPLKQCENLQSVHRYGLLISLSGKSLDFQRSPIDYYLSSDFHRIDTLSMRFTKRLATDQAIAMKRINDFRNAIYSIEESVKGEIEMSIDYQHYFQPALDAESSSDHTYLKFVEQGLRYFTHEFNDWLVKSFSVKEAA